MRTLDILKQLAEFNGPLPTHLEMVRKSLAVMASGDHPTVRFMRLARIFRNAESDITAANIEDDTAKALSVLAWATA